MDKKVKQNVLKHVLEHMLQRNGEIFAITKHVKPENMASTIRN